MKSKSILLIVLLTWLLAGFSSAAVINHDISKSSLIIPGSSTDDYVVTGSSIGNYISAQFGYKGTITLKNCQFRFTSSYGSASPIRIVGQNGLSNTDPNRTNVNLILDGNNTIYNSGGGRAGIQVDQGAQINISAIEPCDNTSGTLTITQASDDGGAGIGSLDHWSNSSETTSTATLSNGRTGTTAGGNIVISSGTITTQGGHGAGIGGGYDTYYDGMIVIYGGVVNASALRHAAGIGSGCPTGNGVVEEYTPNSAVVVLPPASISAKGAGGYSGEEQMPSLGLAGTKVRVYIGDPDKPAIRVSTVDHLPNANIYFDLSQDPDINRVVTTTINSSILNINNVLLGQTNASGIFATTGSLTNPTTFFTDAASTGSETAGNPYIPITKTMPNGGTVEFALLETKISLSLNASNLLENNYTNLDAQKSAAIVKIVYDDPDPITDLTFDLASGASTPFSNLIFLASDSATVVSAPKTLKKGDVYYIIVPAKMGLAPKLYSDVLRMSGTWKGASTGYIRQVISQIVADVQPVYICEGESYYFNGQFLTEEGVYAEVSSNTSTCAVESNVTTIRLMIDSPKYIKQTGRICSGEEYKWQGEILTKGGTYTRKLKTATGACDSIIELELAEYPSYMIDKEARICQGEKFRFANKDLTATGNYFDTLQTVNGCDSIIHLHLVVNQKYLFDNVVNTCSSEYDFRGRILDHSGVYYDSLKTAAGCDSIYKLTLYINNTYHYKDNVIICEGEKYNFFGRELTQSGTYYQKYLSSQGCDSIYELNLTVNPTREIVQTATICQGEKYIFKGKALTQSGIYYDSLQTMYGCDSVIKLVLTVNPSYLYEKEAEICDNKSYLFQGRTLTQSGIYYDSLKTVKGCDSIYKLTLHVHPTFSYETNATICEGEVYEFFGRELTKTGTYYESYITSHGCDSVYKLNLTVTPSYEVLQSAAICEGETYMFRGKVLTEQGTYYDSLTTVHGCDSVIKLVLTINPTYLFEKDAEICDNETYEFRGRTLNQSGTYYDNLQTGTGCDSVFKLNLTVHPTYFFHTVETTCDNHPYSYRGKLYDKSGVYFDSLSTVFGCDSVYRLDLTVYPTYSFEESATICDYETYKFQGKLFSETGIYKDTIPTVHGCDSVYTLHLRVRPTIKDTIDASVCLGEYYLFAGNMLYDDGLYLDTIQEPEGNGCEIHTLRLKTVASTIISTAHVDDACADDTTYQIKYQYTGPTPLTYSLYYDTHARMMGFKDVRDAPFTGYIYDTIPQFVDKIYLRPDIYNVRIEFDNGTCAPSQSAYDLAFMIKYPSWIIEQNWNDVVAVLNADYNGGYSFKQFDWFVNDKEYLHNTKSYIYTPQYMHNGDIVYAQLTRPEDDYAICTCPIVITDLSDTYKYDEPVLVSVNKVSRLLTVSVQKPVTYMIYNTNGDLMQSGYIRSQGENTITCPFSQNGLYIIVFKEGDKVNSSKFIL